MNTRAAMYIMAFTGIMGMMGVMAGDIQGPTPNDSQQLIVQKFIEQFRTTCQTEGMVAIPVIQDDILYIEVYECNFARFQEYFVEDAPLTDKKGKEYGI